MLTVSQSKLNIGQIEKEITTFETYRQDTTTKLAELLRKNDKINEEIVNLSGMKSKFESKVNLWDSKANPAEVKKLDTFVNEEVKKMKKDIEFVLGKNDEISANMKTNSNNGDQETIFVNSMVPHL